MPMVNLRQLRYFVAVARQLHVGHAAGALGLRQPTLSRQIRSLEDALGVSLFERHRAGMRLTAAGRDFLQGANRVLLERSEEHPSELQSLMRISYAVFCLKNKKN